MSVTHARRRERERCHPSIHRVLQPADAARFVYSFFQVFIATAFATCGSGMGWSVTLATVFHELAQEISDYVVLTQPHQANLRPLHALFLNFLSGTSVLIGTFSSVTPRSTP